MIIKSDAFNMESSRQYRSRRTSRQESFLSTLAFANNGVAAQREGGLPDIPAIRQGRMSTLQRVGALPEQLGDIEDQSLQMKFQALNFLFRALFGKNSMGDFADSYWGSATSGIYRTVSYSETFEESEITSFQTTGKVVCEDGRELDFSLNVGMSRSFYEETNFCMMQEKPLLMDPLIIHLEGSVDAISDQTFFFDLDCDGKEEEVSSLKPGAAFLALDRNGDGTINNGSELFGAQSGDGFADLAAYDLDGNGWIDEADEVFDKLRVWSLDAEGNPQMFSLLESDIGAICLASSPTQFSVNDEANNTRAVVRQTGFFLHESTGLAGALQQVDLAVRKK